MTTSEHHWSTVRMIENNKCSVNPEYLQVLHKILTMARPPGHYTIITGCWHQAWSPQPPWSLDLLSERCLLFVPEYDSDDGARPQSDNPCQLASIYNTLLPFILLHQGQFLVSVASHLFIKL